MIEVKDISKGNVKSANKGNDINKFYKDSISTKLGYKFSGNTYSYCLNIIKNVAKIVLLFTRVKHRVAINDKAGKAKRVFLVY